MDDKNFDNALRELLGQFDDYDRHAYIFVSNAVTRTVEKIANKPDSTGARHISGQELVRGAIDCAMEEYKELAPIVLESWGLCSGHDMGIIVFRMIRAGILSASERDKLEDFDTPPDIPALIREEFHLLHETDNIPPVSVQPIA